MMCKWVVTALEPGSSNLKNLLRFKLARYQPYPGNNWTPSLQWFSLPNHAARAGSKVWEQMTRAWKKLAGEIKVTPPNNLDEWLSSSIWWEPSVGAIGPLFSKVWAAAMSRRGLL
jgi:hypothetical protein